jgi:hypothetical protein
VDAGDERKTIMSKYHIQKNKPTPSDEEINKYKDFNKVVKKAAIYDYKQATKPIYKNIKVLGIVAVIAAVGLIILVENNEETGIEKNVNINNIGDSIIRIELPNESTKTISDVSEKTGNTNTETHSQIDHQGESEDSSEVSEETNEPQQMASVANFPGGENALHNFLSKNIKYPYDAVETPFTGKVEVILVIEKTGDIGSINLLHSPNNAITNEIKRVIKLMPKWSPAVKNNQPVVSSVTVYFPFVYQAE